MKKCPIISVKKEGTSPFGKGRRPFFVFSFSENHPIFTQKKDTIFLKKVVSY